jgi:hypothetical protein
MPLSTDYEPPLRAVLDRRIGDASNFLNFTDWSLLKRTQSTSLLRISGQLA